VKMHTHGLRYYVSFFGGHLLVISALFLSQELTLGFLPFWNFLHVGPVPLRPFVFVATSIYLSRRYFQIRGVE